MKTCLPAYRTAPERIGAPNPDLLPPPMVAQRSLERRMVMLAGLFALLFVGVLVMLVLLEWKGRKQHFDLLKSLPPREDPPPDSPIKMVPANPAPPVPLPPDLVVIERPGSITRAKITYNSLLEDTIARQISDRLIQEVDGSPCLALILDVQNIESIGSQGLGELVRVYKKLKARGGEVLLLNPIRELCDLLMIFKLENLFTVIQEEEAPGHATTASEESIL